MKRSGCLVLGRHGKWIDIHTNTTGTGMTCGEKESISIFLVGIEYFYSFILFARMISLPLITPVPSVSSDAMALGSISRSLLFLVPFYIRFIPFSHSPL